MKLINYNQAEKYANKGLFVYITGEYNNSTHAFSGILAKKRGYNGAVHLKNALNTSKESASSESMRVLYNPRVYIIGKMTNFWHAFANITALDDKDVKFRTYGKTEQAGMGFWKNNIFFIEDNDTNKQILYYTTSYGTGVNLLSGSPKRIHKQDLFKDITREEFVDRFTIKSFNRPPFIILRQLHNEIEKQVLILERNNITK